jgi:hypothetical protein
MSTPILPFTGERFTPERAGGVAQQHWHRYAFARPLVAGKRVLDAACGEGYGSALLARHAASVLALDADAPTIAHARQRYGAPNLRFEIADVARLEHLAPASVDVVVCFGTLERVQAQDAVLAGFARLLTDDGVLLVSAPDRRVADDAAASAGVVAGRALYREEFEALLGRHFPRCRLYGQRLAVQSQIWVLDGGPGATQLITRHGQEFYAGIRDTPAVHVAVCAKRGEALAGLPTLSLFADAAPGNADGDAASGDPRPVEARIAALESELARLKAERAAE